MSPRSPSPLSPVQIRSSKQREYVANAARRVFLFFFFFQSDLISTRRVRRRFDGIAEDRKEGRGEKGEAEEGNESVSRNGISLRRARYLHREKLRFPPILKYLYYASQSRNFHRGDRYPDNYFKSTNGTNFIRFENF